jgi:four helix bundle protein
MADSRWKVNEERFSFEDLEVWQEAVDFADQCIEIAERIETNRRHYRLIEQFESSATSPAQNIAEGKGRFSKKEFVHFLYIARGSLFETVTLLVIFSKRGWVKEPEFMELKRDAIKLGKRISSLIKSINQ